MKQKPKMTKKIRNSFPINFDGVYLKIKLIITDRLYFSFNILF